MPEPTSTTNVDDFKEKATACKAAGNTLFDQKDYQGAVDKFSEALVFDAHNAVYYSNRAAAYSHLERLDQALADATRATEIDESNFKAWALVARLLHVHSQKLPESLVAYDKAKHYISLREGLHALKTKYADERKKVVEHMRDPLFMPMDVLKIIANSFDIPLPPSNSAHPTELRLTVVDHKDFRPLPGFVHFTSIKIQENLPIQSLQLDGLLLGPGGGLEGIASQITQLPHPIPELLYCENYIAATPENPNGIPLGQPFHTYVLWTDRDAVANEPINARASTLLCRPGTHGSVAVMKATYVKTTEGLAATRHDLLCYHKVSEEELKSDRFKEMRRSWGELEERMREAAQAAPTFTH